jgi:MFS family permease
MFLLKNLKLFRALSHRPIFVLWAGEAFSAIGDEIYRAALVWLVVGMIGADAGYLAAGQAGAVLFFGLFGGIWADHWDSRQTMIRIDLARALIVLVPVVWVCFMPLNLAVLIGVALSVSALSAFFEPALQAVVPRLARERELMQATNGLMGSTSRLARAVGPGMVGLMSPFVPMIQFFTLDSLSFAISALAIASLGVELPSLPSRARPRGSLMSALFSGFESIRGDSLMKYVIYSKAVASGAWSLVVPLGIALLVQKMLPGNVRAYGFLLGSYGVGNLSGALVVANLSIRRPIRMMALGFGCLGIGFTCMALIPVLPVMMLSAAFGAVGGPMNDLAHIDIIQRRYPPQDLVRIVRFRMAIEYGGMLVCLAAAPLLFSWMSARWVVGLAGVVTLAVAAVGWLGFDEDKASSPVLSSGTNDPGADPRRV